MRAGKTAIIVTHHIHEIPPEIAHMVLLKNGVVMAEGDKRSVLTSESLSTLFDTSIQLAAVNGFFVAVPGAEGRE
jgi:iron complex transport system ATP-binding protein